MDTEGDEVDWLSENLGSHVSADLARATQEVIIVTPYVTLPGIAWAEEAIDPAIGVTLITRFDIMAFALGTTDLKAMLMIASRESGLVRVLPRLHAKIYVRDWRSWWMGSANATGAGLQIGERGNLEILGHLKGARRSLSRILSSIVRESVPVTQRQLERIQGYVADLVVPQYPSAEIAGEETAMWQDLTAEQEGGFMVQELPFAQSPRSFWERLEDHESHEDQLFIHDCVVLGIDAGARGALEVGTEDVALAFREIPVVGSLDEFLAEPRSFGEITAWLHDHCEDRPVPYRREIKHLTARVLNWLLGLYPDRYRRSRPRHSEIFVRIDDAWEPVSRDRLMSRA